MRQHVANFNKFFYDKTPDYISLNNNFFSEKYNDKQSKVLKEKKINKIRNISTFWNSLQESTKKSSSVSYKSQIL